MATTRFCYFCDAAWQHICQEAAFSGREGEIFRRVFQSVKVQTIARELGIKPRTVYEHVTRAFKRLGIQNRQELLILLLDIHFRWWIRCPPLGCRSVFACAPLDKATLMRRIDS